MSLLVVNVLVNKIRKNGKFLQELVHARETIETRRSIIRNIVESTNERDAFIDSADTVKQAVLD